VGGRRESVRELDSRLRFKQMGWWMRLYSIELIELIGAVGNDLLQAVLFVYSR
jgi:hypothetical protein